MNDTLKAAGRIGAELGAAKAELEKLRGLLHGAHDTIRNLAEDLDEEEFQETIDQLAEIELALAPQQAEPKCSTCNDVGIIGHSEVCPDCADTWKQQAEPTDTFTAVEMATAAAQGFRDGQAAVDPAAAKDERKTFEAWAKTQGDKWLIVGGLQWSAGTDDYASARTNAAWAAWQERAARPAQTEQQPEQSGLIKALEYYANGNHLLLADPDAWDTCSGEPLNFLHDDAGTASVEDGSIARVALEAYRAAPIAQTEQQPAFLLEIGADGEYAVQVRDKDWLRSMRNKREHQTHNLYSAPIAQTEQQPVLSNCLDLVEKMTVSVDVSTGDDDAFNRLFCKVAGVQEESDGSWTILAVDPEPNFAALIAQTAPQGKFRMGDLVKKSTGSEWVGRVVGWYSTEQTKEGYAVESSAHRNSVQIYPVTALEAVE